MNIARLLKQSCTIYNSTGTDKYGKATAGSGTAADCRFERRSKNVLDIQGEQTTIHAVVFLKPDVSVSIGDRLDYNSQTYKVITIADQVNGRGVAHHKELGVQLWRQ